MDFPPRSHRPMTHYILEFAAVLLGISASLYAENVQELQRNERIKNQSLSAAYERWSESVREIRTMAAKARKVMTRWINQSSAMCLDAWRETTLQEVRKRALMKRIVVRMGSKTLSSAFMRSDSVARH